MVTTTRPHRRSTRRATGLLVAAVLGLLATACTDDTEWDAQRAAQQAAEPQIETSTMPTATAEELSAALSTTMERYDVAGAAVAARDAELGEWVATAGVADRETDEPVTAQMEWPLRSATKSFTVTLLLQLVDEGEVSLDDTIDQWVDGVPNGDRVTLRQLADMTAGVPEYITDAFVEDFSADPGAAFTPQQLIGYALSEEPVSEPGEEHIYINTSTLLLGEVVEQVTGQNFEQALAERILDPLALADTTYPTEPDGWTTDHATGYQPDDDGQSAAPSNFTVFGAAGAMLSTLDDMLAWGPVLARGRPADRGDAGRATRRLTARRGPRVRRVRRGRRRDRRVVGPHG